MHELIGWIGTFLLDTYRMKFPAQLTFAALLGQLWKAKMKFMIESTWFTTLRPMNTKLKMFVYKLLK